MFKQVLIVFIVVALGALPHSAKAETIVGATTTSVGTIASTTIENADLHLDSELARLLREFQVEESLDTIQIALYDVTHTLETMIATHTVTQIGIDTLVTDLTNIAMRLQKVMLKEQLDASRAQLRTVSSDSWLLQQLSDYYQDSK